MVGAKLKQFNIWRAQQLIEYKVKHKARYKIPQWKEHPRKIMGVIVDNS